MVFFLLVMWCARPPLSWLSLITIYRKSTHCNNIINDTLWQQYLLATPHATSVSRANTLMSVPFFSFLTNKKAYNHLIPVNSLCLLLLLLLLLLLSWYIPSLYNISLPSIVLAFCPAWTPICYSLNNPVPPPLSLFFWLYSSFTLLFSLRPLYSPLWLTVSFKC